MKFVSFLMFSNLLFMAGCAKNALTSPGAISFYSDKISGTGAAAPAINRSTYWFENYVTGAKIYITKIEISIDGTKWEKVCSETEVNVTYQDLNRFGSPINVPEGQYEGIRIEYEPKVTFYLANSTNTVTITSLPEQLFYINGSITPIVNNITFSSANGYLTPFKIERGAETFMIFEFRPIPWTLGQDKVVNNDISSWHMGFAARASRFLQ
jgi:hypothetical protein